MKSQAVAWWHTSLRAIAVLNVTLWGLAAVAVMHLPAGKQSACVQLLLSAGYVAGCAYRSFLPVIDIPRLVLIDSRLSSVLVGRSIATVAELCFAAQWALILHDIALPGGGEFARAVSWALVPLIVVAEGFSWYAVLTGEQRAHAVENSLWGISAALAIVGMLLVGPNQVSALYPLTLGGGSAYVAFIFFYDVPMYRSRWLADQASRRKYLTLAEGMADVCRRWAVSYRWADWKSEIPWMSLYFTSGVWSSIWLVHVALALAHSH
jgi:hypothetical protein